MLVVARSRHNKPAETVTSTFTGTGWRDRVLRDDAVNVGRILFAPAARTHWHSHEHGQLLVITGGQGLICTSDQAVRVSEGDIVWTAPGVTHWHGACADHHLAHTAASFGAVTWHGPVSDEDYTSADGDTRSDRPTASATANVR
jgi:quercetin dioxygenase-like cupin family protein